MNEFGSKKHSGLSLEQQESAEPGNSLAADQVPHLIKWGMNDIQLSLNVTPAPQPTGRWTWTNPRVKLIAFSSMVLALARSFAPAATYYVATNGSDSNPGTLARPFATLDKARDTLRTLAPLADGATVFLRGGTYYRTTTFTLTSADSGVSSNAPIIYRSYTNESAVIVGGLPITNFVAHSGSILKANVSTQSLSGIDFDQLLFDGARQPLARTPNYSSADPIGGGWAYADGTLVSQASSQGWDSTTIFTNKVTDLTRFGSWANPTRARVFIFPRYNWNNNICPVSTINTNTRRITLASAASYAIRPGDRYYVERVFEELDQAGEWYLNTNTAMVYFWPPDSMSGKAVYVPVVDYILLFNSAVANVTFRNLQFECCTSHAIYIYASTNCVIAASTIKNVGGFDGCGVRVLNGAYNGIVGCDISYAGSYGIRMGDENQYSLAPGSNYADNNYIKGCGVYDKTSAGIFMEGVGTRATHNLIVNLPRHGIKFSGVKMLIEDNDVGNVNLETDDSGVVDSSGGRQWIYSRGTRISHNYFHDSYGYGAYNGVRLASFDSSYGIYLDDNSGGVDSYSNIVVNCSSGGIMLHNARDCSTTNNVFVNSGTAIAAPQIRFHGWSTTQGDWAANLSTMITGYESYMQGNPAWASMRSVWLHPTNATLPDNTYMSNNVFAGNIVKYVGTNYLYMSRNINRTFNDINNNVVWNVSGSLTNYIEPTSSSWAQWQATGSDADSVVGDPLLNADYSLQPSSPALALGIHSISTNGIGVYEDDLRASWPVGPVSGAKPLPPANPRVQAVGQ
jgi:hypothetical protein